LSRVWHALRVELVTEKWGGIPHYRTAVRLLGDDEFGLWCWSSAPRRVLRGDGTVLTGDKDALYLVPTDWWTVTWYLGHPRAEFYVNISTPPVVEPDRIVSVDTDLDVIGWLDGSVEVVDQDEFKDHQVRYGYPPEVIESTERAAIESFARASSRTPPFDGTAVEHWVEQARLSPRPAGASGTEAPDLGSIAHDR
jgi:uncharacterized protein